MKDQYKYFNNPHREREPTSRLSRFSSSLSGMKHQAYFTMMLLTAFLMGISSAMASITPGYDFVCKKAGTSCGSEVAGGMYELIPDDSYADASVAKVQGNWKGGFDAEFSYQIWDDDGGPWSYWNSADGFVFMFNKDLDAYSSSVTLPDGSSRAFIADGTGYGVHIRMYGWLRGLVTLVDGNNNWIDYGWIPYSTAYTGAGNTTQVKVSVSDNGVKVFFNGSSSPTVDASFSSGVNFDHSGIAIGAATGGADGRHRVSRVTLTSDLSLACPLTLGHETLMNARGRYLANDIPPCAQETISNLLMEFIDGDVIAQHYNLYHPRVEITSASPIFAQGREWGIGGFYGGHRNYLRGTSSAISDPMRTVTAQGTITFRGAEEFLRDFNFDWAPNGRLPIIASDRDLPSAFQRVTPSPCTPSPIPGSMSSDDADARPCISPQYALLNDIRDGGEMVAHLSNGETTRRPAQIGWNDAPPRNVRPRVRKPSSIQGDDNLCRLLSVNALFSAQGGWHGSFHGSVGGAMGTFDSPALPLFWLWHTTVDDLWQNWADNRQDCR